MVLCVWIQKLAAEFLQCFLAPSSSLKDEKTEGKVETQRQLKEEIEKHNEKMKETG